jgi:hypothetical protein
LEVALATLVPLMSLLEEVPDPRRAEGKLYKLPHAPLFSILAIVTGCNSYCSIVTFIVAIRRRPPSDSGLCNANAHVTGARARLSAI